MLWIYDVMNIWCYDVMMFSISIIWSITSDDKIVTQMEQSQIIQQFKELNILLIQQEIDKNSLEILENQNQHLISRIFNDF